MCIRDRYTIHDARVKALTVGGNPYFEIGDNSNGSEMCIRDSVRREPEQ